MQKQDAAGPAMRLPWLVELQEFFKKPPTEAYADAGLRKKTIGSFDPAGMVSKYYLTVNHPHHGAVERGEFRNPRPLKTFPCNLMLDLQSLSTQLPTGCGLMMHTTGLKSSKKLARIVVCTDKPDQLSHRFVERLFKPL